MHTLIPNRETLATQLERLCRVCHADEVVLFERATFLVISHAVSKEHGDVHRFEKVPKTMTQLTESCPYPKLIESSPDPTLTLTQPQP